MGGKGGKTVIEAPQPVNVEESMRDYLNAITDPELVGKQLDAEAIFGPQFDVVSLARTQTMLEGIKDPKESAMYLQATARRAALEVKKAALEAGTPEEIPSADDVNAIVNTIFPKPKAKTRESDSDYNKRLKKLGYERQREILVNQYSTGLNVSSLDEIDQELADANNEITRIENMPAQKGILDMAEESAQRMSELQVKVDRAKREGDIADLEDLGPGLVEALRKADPQSTALAEASAARAERAQDRAMIGQPQSRERVAMGDIAQQGRDRIAQLEALEAEARTPAENQELQNLKSIRDKQTGMFAQAQARAEDPRSIRERATMGFLGDAATFDAMRLGQDPSRFEEFQNLQQLGDMSMLSAEAAQARAMSPNLAEGRGQLGALADAAQREAFIPSEERAALGDMAQQSQDFAVSLMQQAQNPALPNEERQRLIAMSQQQQARADDIYARAGEVSPEQQALRDSATAMRARGDEMFARAGEVSPEQQQLRNQASAMQERAQSLFAQAEAAPSEQKQQLQAAAMDMMQRGQGLFAQAATPSSARQAAGELAQLSAQQARQLSSDALGPLSAQRRRMAEQAARQQGLRTGRIGDQMQLASELLNREEQRALLRAEAREAQDLAFRQASGFATDIETDAERLRQQALGFETGGFDRARDIEGDIDAQRLSLLQEGRLVEGQAFDAGLGIEGQISQQELARQGRALEASQLGMQEGRLMEGQISQQELDRLAEGRATAGQAFDMGRDVQTDLDDLSRQRQDQAMLAQGQAFTQTGDLITADRAARDEAAGRQQAVMSADAAFREEARLERAAAEAQQQGLLDEARELRDEAATRRSEALEIQQGIAEFDRGLRDEAQAALDDEARMTAGLISTEETLRQQRADEAARLRGEISAAGQTAFAQQGQLAAMDESLRATALSEADAASQTAFNQARNISAPATGYLTGVAPGAAQAGSSFVSQGPQVSQSFGEMFNPERGIDIANVNTSNMLNRNIAQANVDAQDRASRSGMFGNIVGAFIKP